MSERGCSEDVMPTQQEAYCSVLEHGRMKMGCGLHTGTDKGYLRAGIPSAALRKGGKSSDAVVQRITGGGDGGGGVLAAMTRLLWLCNLDLGLFTALTNP